MRLILASKSKTRALILKSHGVEFSQIGIDFDEDSLEYSKPRDFVYYATKGKMETYLSKYDLEIPVLCADTVVCADDIILRKAKDVEDARKILLRQSGNSVSILTCMIYKSYKMEFIDLNATKYLFSPFDMGELDIYLKSDEWRGKAGACMVEGFCKKYIKEVIGLQSTAMGLGIEKLMPFLELNDVL
ncbi:MAG: septum formation inhibitor Maf [Sulfurospirillum sp.]